MATLGKQIGSGKSVNQLVAFINSIYNGQQPNDLVIINEHLKMLIRQSGVVEIEDLEGFKSAKGYFSWKKEYLGKAYGDTIRIVFEGDNNTRITLVYSIATKMLIADESFAFAINYF